MLCNTSFEANNLLQDHFINYDKKGKTHECKDSSPKFVLKWKLMKHIEGHTWDEGVDIAITKTTNSKQ